MYQELKKRLRGSIAPVVTPFNEDYSIDFETQEKLINWQIENGSHAISVCGTTGEPSSLTTEERVKVMENAARVINGRVPFVPATGSVNFDETIYLTQKAKELGADAVLIIVPYYNKPSQHALYDHYKTIAETVDVPIIVYNIPGRTAVNLHVDTLARLVKDVPQIIGVKESNKDFEHVNRVLQKCGRDFNLYSGIELLCYPMLAIGGAGHISATANLLPKEIANLYNDYEAGNIQGALDHHFELMELNDVLFEDTNPAPLKAAMGMMGIAKPILRRPMALPSQELQDKLRNILKRHVELPENVVTK